LSITKKIPTKGKECDKGGDSGINLIKITKSRQKAAAKVSLTIRLSELTCYSSMACSTPLL
jgi:hypothetical protein